ncbi:hypothetical protein NL676_000984 [Syzygium grande]|nr:hypothetical protein NL676_000984 [Syzygium grande]
MSGRPVAAVMAEAKKEDGGELLRNGDIDNGLWRSSYVRACLEFIRRCWTAADSPDAGDKRRYLGLLRNANRQVSQSKKPRDVDGQTEGLVVMNRMEVAGIGIVEVASPGLTQQ